MRLKECDGCAPEVERHRVIGFKYVFELVSAKECVELCVNYDIFTHMYDVCPDMFTIY